MLPSPRRLHCFLLREVRPFARRRSRRTLNAATAAKALETRLERAQSDNDGVLETEAAPSTGDTSKA